MIPNILNIQDAMPCVVKNITDKLKLDVANLLTDFTIMLIILQIVLEINLLVQYSMILLKVLIQNLQMQ